MHQSKQVAALLPVSKQKCLQFVVKQALDPPPELEVTDHQIANPKVSTRFAKAV